MFLLVLFLSSVAAKAPHIIVIVADDLGFHDVSWHNDVVLTPHLADLASQGITLEQHYSQPICSPTRGALLTGRYDQHHIFTGFVRYVDSICCEGTRSTPASTMV